MIINITAYDRSRARPRPPVGKWVMSTCGGACRKKGSRKYPRASKKMIQDTCTQPARPRGGRESHRPELPRLFLWPLSQTSLRVRAHGPQASASHHGQTSLSRPAFAGPWEPTEVGDKSQHWAPGGAQDLGQACSLPGPRRISKIRGGLFHASGSSCSEGLCLTYAGPQSRCEGTHRKLLSLREGTADGLTSGMGHPEVALQCLCVCMWRAGRREGTAWRK